MAHGDAREGKWRGNWQMEWVASTLTLPRNVAYPALLPLMRTTRLPVADWTDAPADLNGLVHFGKRLNVVSAHVPPRFKRSLILDSLSFKNYCRTEGFVDSIFFSFDKVHIFVLLVECVMELCVLLVILNTLQSYLELFSNWGMICNVWRWSSKR
jgi:hypothetical protein